MGISDVGAPAGARDVTTYGAEPSALAKAGAGPQGHGLLAGSVVGLVESLLDVGIDGRGPFQSAQAVADHRRERSADAEGAVAALVHAHLRLAAAGGFVTGVGGFVTLPVALPANVVEFYLVATRMVAATAALRGYDISRPEIRSAVLLTLVGADADDLVGRAGVRRAGRFSGLVAERLPGPAMMVVNKALGFKLITAWGKHAVTRFGKAVPVVGGAFGAGLDAYLLKRIADHARHEFPPRPAGAQGRGAGQGAGEGRRSMRSRRGTDPGESDVQGGRWT